MTADLRVRADPGVEPSLEERIFELTLTRSLGLAALRAAVALELFDHVDRRPRRVEAIAKEVGCPPESLRRLLLALTNQGLIEFDSSEGFRLTSCGALLQRSADGSLYDFVAFILHPYRTRALERLDEAIRSNRTAVEVAYGRTEWEDMAAQPAFRTTFDRGMASLTARLSYSLLANCSFDGVRRIVDVGGGYGELLGAILRAHPEASGLLLDLPGSVDGARQHLAAMGVVDRTELVGGSFLESVPGGADLYLLKSVLHNWHDSGARRILSNIARAMPTGARLLIIERLLPSNPGPSGVYEVDLNMLAFPGGRERTETEYRTLLQSAGLQLSEVRSLPGAWWVLEAISS